VQAEAEDEQNKLIKEMKKLRERAERDAEKNREEKE
jgi:hypothetical protein